MNREEILESIPVKELTQDIFNSCSSSIKSAAVDRFGIAWGFTTEHIAKEISWEEKVPTNKVNAVLLGSGYDESDWRNSLIIREHSNGR